MIFMFPFLEFAGFKIPMYGLSITIGVLVSAALAVRDCKIKKLVPENMIVISLSGLLLGLLGAKLTYIFITFSFSEIVDIIKSGHFDSLINGGFVFYGGLIFGILGALIGTKLAHAKLRDYENVIIKVIPLAHAFGRIGCLCAGCCYGAPTDSIFSVTYSTPLSDAPVGVPLIPIQLYEATANFILFIILSIIDKKKPDNKILLPTYFAIYSIERYIIEFFRYDKIRGSIGIFSSSQLISIFLLVAAIILFTYRHRKNIYSKNSKA